jgi:hypothetical protein
VLLQDAATGAVTPIAQDVEAVSPNAG